MDCTFPSWSTYKLVLDCTFLSWSTCGLVLDCTFPSWNTCRLVLDCTFPSWRTHTLVLDCIFPSWSTHRLVVDGICPFEGACDSGPRCPKTFVLLWVFVCVQAYGCREYQHRSFNYEHNNMREGLCKKCAQHTEIQLI